MPSGAAVAERLAQRGADLDVRLSPAAARTGTAELLGTLISYAALAVLLWCPHRVARALEAVPPRDPAGRDSAP